MTVKFRANCHGRQAFGLEVDLTWSEINKVLGKVSDSQKNKLMELLKGKCKAEQALTEYITHLQKQEKHDEI